jgi:hypothetical protein
LAKHARSAGPAQETGGIGIIRLSGFVLFGGVRSFSRLLRAGPVREMAALKSFNFLALFCSAAPSRLPRRSLREKMEPLKSLLLSQLGHAAKIAA